MAEPPQLKGKPRTAIPMTNWCSKVKTWADKEDSDRSRPVWLLHRLVRLLLITSTEFIDNGLSLRAAALTYTVLLSLVPILAMSTAILKGFGGDDQLRKAVYGYMDTLTDGGDRSAKQPWQTADGGDATLPDKSDTLTDHLHAAVDRLFAYVDRTNFAALGSIGVIGVLLSVFLVLSYIEDAMNSIWKVTSGRSLPRKIADYLTLLILFPISMNVAFAAGALLQSPTLTAELNRLLPFPWLQPLLLKAMPVTVITLTFYILYLFFPNTRVKALPALLGAALAACLWTLVQSIYISLQIGVANYNAIYGSFATLPLFLLWIYLGWLFILCGGQVAYTCQNLATYRLQSSAPSPAMILGAAFDIIDCIVAAFAEGKKITAENLANRLPCYTPIIIDLVLEHLHHAGLLHISQTDKRLLPVSTDNVAQYRRIIGALLGDDAADTAGGLRSKNVVAAAAEKAGTSP